MYILYFMHLKKASFRLSMYLISPLLSLTTGVRIVIVLLVTSLSTSTGTVVDCGSTTGAARKCTSVS